MKRIIQNQIIHFELSPSEKILATTIELEGMKVILNIEDNSIYHGRELAPKWDWDCVDAFVDFYIQNHFLLQKKAQAKLAKLVRKIGWWSEEEMSYSTFELDYVATIKIRTKVFLGEKHKFEDSFIFEMVYLYEGSATKCWVDVYGLWFVEFKNDNCVGARRVQC